MADPFNLNKADISARLRYVVRLTDRGRPFHVVIINLTLPRFSSANRIREALNRKVFDYIKAAYPNMLGINGQVLGRVDQEI